MQYMLSITCDTHQHPFLKEGVPKANAQYQWHTIWAWPQIDNPHKHYAMTEHYVIRHHNKKLDQIVTTLADKQIHMVQLIHLTWLAARREQAVPADMCFAGCWFGRLHHCH